MGSDHRALGLHAGHVTVFQIRNLTMMENAPRYYPHEHSYLKLAVENTVRRMVDECQSCVVACQDRIDECRLVVGGENHGHHTYTEVHRQPPDDLSIDRRPSE
jgi:hypothetical protein